MDENLLQEDFNAMKDNLNLLGVNLKQSLEWFLKEEGISYLSVSYRVKDEASFIEKIKRKKYIKPFEECEDLCGIRIICYYKSDIDRIKNIIEKELVILHEENKEELLGYDQFGYRSDHFIVKIKDEWAVVPNYRGLVDIKVEIQVRTILMHSWAEIQHKLAYKKEEDIPRELRRKFSLLSAKLEESDDQFEVLRNSITSYRKSIVEDAKVNNIDNLKSSELNLDNLQAFLDFAYGDRVSSIEDTSGVLHEFTDYGISMEDILCAYEEYNEFLLNIEKLEAEEYKLKERHWVQVGALRVLMELYNDNFYFERKGPGRDVRDFYKKISENNKN